MQHTLRLTGLFMTLIYIHHCAGPGPEVIKLALMLNSTEHEISTPANTKTF